MLDIHCHLMLKEEQKANIWLQRTKWRNETKSFVWWFTLNNEEIVQAAILCQNCSHLSIFFSREGKSFPERNRLLVASCRWIGNLNVILNSCQEETNRFRSCNNNHRCQHQFTVVKATVRPFCFKSRYTQLFQLNQQHTQQRQFEISFV